MEDGMDERDPKALPRDVQTDSTLGNKLWRFRMEQGLTQQELAAKANVSQSAIAQLEKGSRTQPYPSTLRKLSEALGISISDLLPAAAAPLVTAITSLGS
jgi:transcriptional regulator with XRE-family HTH domain